MFQVYMYYTMKRIILMRHAEAEDRSNEGDFFRKLTEKGKAQAAAAAEFISKFVVDKAIVSTSVRTKQTLDIVLDRVNIDNIEYSGAIYDRSQKEIMELLCNQSDDITNILIIGHNPTIYELALFLTNNDPKLINFSMTPASVIVIQIQDLKPATGRLQEIFFHKTKLTNAMSNNNQDTYTTKRATVEAMEELLYEPIRVLDHGFIRVVDYMGDDNAIVQAARVSYGKGTKQVNQDKGLINYLMRHSHTTPFEMCEIKFHIKLPIFIARQWIRHRTASVNEYSARYSILSKEFYVPRPQDLSTQSEVNKQCRSDKALPAHVSERVLSIIKEDSVKCYDHYLEMLNEDEKGNIINENNTGIARELARMNLTLNYYTEWYWKVNLHNLLHFLRLRADSHAQYEIREYAVKMLDIVKRWVPFAYESFEEHKMHGAGVSRKGIEVIKKMIKGCDVTHESSGMSKREWEELMKILS
jgi:thymidylate synthase (FAD)